MSYRTYHTLYIVAPEMHPEIIQELREFSTDAASAFNNEGCPEFDISWSDYEEELREFSLKYPDTLFELHGEGEEDDDKWNHYFKDGKAQFCAAEITYPDYNPDNLK